MGSPPGPRNPNFFPLAGPFLIALFLCVALVIGLLQLDIIEYAYEKVGIGKEYVLGLLVASLLGSYVNIPIARFASERSILPREVSVFGMRYVIPVAEEQPGTVLAVNVGGAVLPTLLSLYLVVRNGTYLDGVAAVSIVTIVVHRLARPVHGVGIAVPTFIPPLLAALVGLLLSRNCAPCVAYVGGSLGTLIGADLLNLGKIRGLGAPVASIGGAGTFDGIFLTGILAVLLA
jgi:uncharacterized membrane protein